MSGGTSPSASSRFAAESASERLEPTGVGRRVRVATAADDTKRANRKTRASPDNDRAAGSRQQKSLSPVVAAATAPTPAPAATPPLPAVFTPAAAATAAGLLGRPGPAPALAAAPGAKQKAAGHVF